MIIKYRKRQINVITIIQFLYIISAMISFFVCVSNERIVDGYRHIILFPILAAIFGIVLFTRYNVQKTGVLVVSIFLAVQWLRLILLPLLGNVSGYFDTYGNHIDTKAAEIATYLIIYETIFSYIFCYLILRISAKRKERINKFELKGNSKIYIIFIIFSVFIFIASGAESIHFFTLSLSGDRLASTSLDDSSIINAIVSYGFTFLIILIFYYCYVKYRRTNKKGFVYFALGCALLRLCLIMSEGRLSQVYLLGTFLMTLPLMFPKYRKRIINFIIITAIVVLGIMTVYKLFYAFLYESYIQAIQESAFSLYDASTQIDIYFYGIKTVARNITFCMQSDLNFLQMITDFLRNTFGVHYLFDGYYSTVEQYNLYMYNGRLTSGHLLSSIAYGYLYLSGLLAPLCTCFNILIAFWIEKILTKVKYLDIYYIGCLIFIRSAITIFSNFPQTWNVISRTLIIGAIIVGGASIFIRYKVKRDDNG